MVTLMFWIAATLLVICLMQFAAILGLRSMLKSANDDLVSLGRLVDVCQERTDKLDALADQVNETIKTITKQRDDAIEEMTRISCELAVAKLSLKNAQDQFDMQTTISCKLQVESDEYKDMLKNIAHIFANERDLLDEVLKEWQDFEAQGG